MQITITVPEMKCAKCDTTAPVQPHMLFSKSQPPAQFREMFSSLLKERTDANATDSNGEVWGILADDKPAGWMKGPNASDLCGSCSALWIATGLAFLSPPVIVSESADAVAQSKDSFPDALPPAPSMTYGSFTPTPMRRQY